MNGKKAYHQAKAAVFLTHAAKAFAAAGRDYEHDEALAQAGVVMSEAISTGYLDSINDPDIRAAISMLGLRLGEVATAMKDAGEQRVRANNLQVQVNNLTGKLKREKENHQHTINSNEYQREQIRSLQLEVHKLKMDLEAAVRKTVESV